MFDVSFDFDNNIINYNYLGDIEDEFIVDIVDIDNNLRIFNTIVTVSPNCGYWTGTIYSFNKTNGMLISFTNSQTTYYYKSKKTQLDKNLYINGNKTIFHNLDNCQYFTYDEVLLSDTYKKIDIKENDIVIDVGANIGLFSLLCLSKNVKKIYVVEPVKETFNILKDNLDPYKEKIVLYKVGLSDYDREAEFSSNGWSSINSLHATGDDKISVSLISPDNLMNSILEDNIDLIKIDVEGSEYDVFSTFSDKNILRINKFIIEIHHVDNRNLSDIHHIINRMIKLGYFYSGDLWSDNTYNLSDWRLIPNILYFKK